MPEAAADPVVIRTTTPLMGPILGPVMGEERSVRIIGTGVYIALPADYSRTRDAANGTRGEEQDEAMTGWRKWLSFVTKASAQEPPAAH
jgi:hypothetical protein